VVAVIWGERHYGDVSDELMFGNRGNFVSAACPAQQRKNPEQALLGVWL
jgi:hypothetical protein